MATDATAMQEEWNDAARTSAIAEFGVLHASEVEGGSRGIDELIAARRIIAVQASERLFPAFQFNDEGVPRAVIAQVLTALGDELHGWEILTWFTGSSGYLEGARPVDLLTDAPDDVVAAAAYQASLSED